MLRNSFQARIAGVLVLLLLVVVVMELMMPKEGTFYCEQVVVRKHQAPRSFLMVAQVKATTTAVASRYIAVTVPSSQAAQSL